MISEIEPGTLIHSRYQIQKFLGKGGFGRTYLALDNERFNETCVLKEFVPTTSKEENLRKCKELFEREAKVLYQIQHPQVPKFLAWFTDNQRIFIVQEYIDGKTYSEILSDRIAQKGQAFSEIEVRTWLMDVLPVLEYLHERKIIHRDISLENIMLPYNQSKPVLIDFGVVQENFTQIMSPDSLNFYNSIRHPVVGKFGYSPPEQLRLGHSYPSSDIYALGVCAVVLLTGKTPNFLLDESLNWQWRSQVNISDNFAIILETMLAEVPNARFQSAKEILFFLNNLHSSSPVSPHLTLKIIPQLENINFFKKRKLEKETEKALEELLILKKLEIELRQSHGTNDNVHPEKPIYLDLDVAEYIEQKSNSSIDSSARVLIKTPLIAAKLTEVLTRLITEQTVKNSANNNKSFIKCNIQEFMENSCANSNLEFLELIQQELTNLIGPITSLIINEVLAVFPDCSPSKLIEILAAEIPDKLTAVQFKEDINNIIKSKLYLLQQQTE
ncbi:serine/threonine protein kinase [Tolypothrix campylonemoides VB511288]|nr:serine/threonine protein kinase [Tolypothrix campylonemoides VB511288]